jgi:hypothetical protein
MACEICGHMPAIRVDVRSLTGLLIVTGMPMFEARRTSSLSGMIPSSGTARISCTSSTVSISPRSTRWRS